MKHERFATGMAAAFDALAASLLNAYRGVRLAGQRMQPNAALQLQDGVQTEYARFMTRVRILAGEYEGAQPLVDQLSAIAKQAVAETVRRSRSVDMKALFPSDPEGGMRDLLRRAQSTIEFKSKDGAGRIWPSLKLVRFLARDFAYQAGITATARDLSTQGDLAQVSYLDSSHVNHGMVVSLSGKPGYPSFESVRATIFHPNSSAQLTHVHP